MSFGAGRKVLKPIAGLHWGYLLIAAGAHAAGIYALTYANIGHHFGIHQNASSGSTDEPISVTLLTDVRAETSLPAALILTQPLASQSIKGKLSHAIESLSSRAIETTSTQNQAAVRPVEARPPPSTAAKHPPFAEQPETPAQSVSGEKSASKHQLLRMESPNASAIEGEIQTQDPTQDEHVDAAAHSDSEAAGATTKRPLSAVAAAAESAVGLETASPELIHAAARFDASHLRNPPPAYPASSRRRGEEGVVILRVRVSASGRAHQIEVAESSGYARLDRAAETAVSRWRFEPARAGDSAIDSWVRVPIAFRLEHS